MRGRRVAAVALVFGLGLALILLLEFSSRPAGLSWQSPLGQTILWRIRLPRLLLALAAGGLLSVVGACFQTLFRNPLAEPYTLGVASGAALGAVTAIHLGLAAVVLPGLGELPVIGVAAFAGALAVTALLIAVDRRRRGAAAGLDPTTVLLAGVVIALTCSALILLLQALADYTQTFRMVRWMMGGLATVDYTAAGWLAVWSLATLAAAIAAHRPLDLLLTGQEFAQGRGLDVVRFRRRSLTLASLAVGAAVAVVGPIGFVGLVVPHLARRLVGSRHGVLLPASWLLGAVLLAAADLGARRILAPAELPVGVVTALVGAPVFLWVLLRRVGGRG